MKATEWEVIELESPPEDAENRRSVPMKAREHLCEGKGIASGSGPAVEYCVEYCEEVQGALWAGNSMYESQVNFCPFCGWMADVLI